MLADQEAFDRVQDALIHLGKIKDFEKESGKITGHMMILPVDIPENIEVKRIPDKTPQGFEATFDFYDVAIGLALYTDTMQVASGVWITPQIDDAEEPAADWVRFFIEKLSESIEEDGSYGYPICSFVNDTSDMTVAPTKPIADFTDTQ